MLHILFFLALFSLPTMAMELSGEMAEFAKYNGFYEALSRQPSLFKNWYIPGEIRILDALQILNKWLIEKQTPAYASESCNIFSAPVFNDSGTLVARPVDWVASGYGMSISRCATGEEYKLIDCHRKHIWTIAFNPAGTLIASASSDGTAKIWNVGSGDLMHTLQGDSGREVFSAVFSAQGDRILTTESNTCAIWDVETGKKMHTFSCYHGVNTLADFNHDGTEVWILTARDTVKIFDVNTGAFLRKFHIKEAISFTANKTRTLRAIIYRNRMEIRDGRTGELIRELKPTQDRDQRHSITKASFNNSGTLIARGYWDGTVDLWNVESGERITNLKVIEDIPISKVVFDGSDRQLIIGAMNCAAKVWIINPLALLRDTITIDQALLLKYLYQIDQAKFLYQTYAPKEIFFDFEEFPHLRQAFLSLPEAIRRNLTHLTTNLDLKKNN